MFNERKLIDALADAQVGHGTLAPVVETDVFQAFLASRLLAEKRARLAAPHYEIGEMAGLYEDNDVVIVLAHGEWAINLVRHQALSNMMYVVPSSTLQGPIEGGCTLGLYDYPRHIDQDPGHAAGTCARKVGEIELGPGEFWATTPDIPAYRLLRQSPGTVFLRVAGPTSGHYTHAFDGDDLRYLYSGFSTAEAIGMDVFSRLMLATSDAGALSSLDGSEARDVGAMLARFISSPSTASPSAWNFVQALHAVDAPRALAIVASLAAAPGPLARVARETLADMHA